MYLCGINIYCKPTYFKRRVERHFSSKMKRKSRDWDLTLELSCHAGCPTGYMGTDKVGPLRMTGSDVSHVSCPEVCSAHAQPEVAQYPP